MTTVELRDLREAFAELGVDPYDLTAADFAGPAPLQRCAACSRQVEATVTTGVRAVCLPCATRLTTEREER